MAAETAGRRRIPRRPNGFWEGDGGLERIKFYLTMIANSKIGGEGYPYKPAGQFPSGSQLEKIGYGGMVKSIYRNYTTTLRALAEELGYHSTRSWADLDTIRFYLRSIANTEIRDGERVIKPAGRFPTEEQLDIEYKGMKPAIYRRHKTTLRELANELGFAFSRKPPNYWKEWKNFEAALIKETFREYVLDGRVIKPEGVMPSKNTLSSMRLNALAVYAHRHHGGYATAKQRVRQNLGMRNGKADVVSVLDMLIDRHGLTIADVPDDELIRYGFIRYQKNGDFTVEPEQLRRKVVEKASRRLQVQTSA